MKKRFVRKKKTASSVVKPSKDRYVILSMSMIEVEGKTVPVFQLKDRQEDLLVIKTAVEIILTPEMVYSMSKPDLLQVSYFAGNMVH